MKRKHPTRGKVAESLLIGFLGWMTVLFVGCGIMKMLGLL